MTQTLSINLGAAIALATSIVVEFVRLRLADARTKRLFKSLPKIEIPTVCGSIDALVTSFNELAFS